MHCKWLPGQLRSKCTTVVLPAILSDIMSAGILYNSLYRFIFRALVKMSIEYVTHIGERKSTAPMCAIVTVISRRPTGWSKLGKLFVRLNFIKDWPIFEVISLRKILIRLSLKIPPHLKYGATLPCEMSVSSKHWKRDDFSNNPF